MLSAIGKLKLDVFPIAALFTMSITTGLVLPLLLPHPSYIAFALLAIAFVMSGIDGKNMHQVNARMMLTLLVLFILFSIISFMTKSGNESFVATLQTPILFILLTAVLLTAKQEDLTRLLRYYIIFCIVMAFCGIVAWVLINWNFVDYRDSLWSLYDATAGRANRDEGTYGYSFPYGLGLVLTGSYRYDIFSYLFFRGSGWAHEPTSAAAFIAPALIILAREPLFGLRIRQVFFIILAAFWATCAAFGSALSFLGLSCFYFFFKKGRHAALRRIIMIVLIGILFNIYIEAQKIFSKTTVTMETPHLSLLESKLTLQAKDSDISRLLNLLTPDTLREFIILSVLLLVAGITLWFAVRTIRQNNTTTASFALILVYFFLHSLKGSWDQLFTSFFVVGFFFLFLRTYLSHWDITHTYSNR